MVHVDDGAFGRDRELMGVVLLATWISLCIYAWPFGKPVQHTMGLAISSVSAQHSELSIQKLPAYATNLAVWCLPPDDDILE